MYTLTTSSVPLSREEEQIYANSLKEHGITPSIWDLYRCTLGIQSKHSSPQIVRIQKDGKDCAHFYLVKCTDYGQALSSSPFVHGMVRMMRLPSCTWIKASIAAETNANPGFFCHDNEDAGKMKGLIKFLHRKYFILFIHDHCDKRHLYPGSLIIPYADLGNVILDKLTGIQDYLAQHKNLKKKIRKFSKEGGRVERIEGRLNDHDRMMVEHCIYTSSKKSIFSLPYQDIYPEMCGRSTEIEDRRFIHFICRSDNEFFGYHSFLRCDTHLRCMHGAFNRDLRTTFHAYENMIYNVVEYGIEHQLNRIYFGPVLNETKRRMMNEFVTTKLYVYSRFPGMLKLMAPFLLRSRMTSRQVRSFASVQQN